MIFKIDPLQDPRWPALVEKHPLASVYHTRGWLEAIHRTYGFRPTAYTSSAPSSELSNGLVFCRIRGLLSGSGLVSLPYSDHCEPLCESPEELDFLMGCLQAEMDHREWKYLEMRPIRWNLNRRGERAGFRPLKTYVLRRLDLRPSVDDMFRRLHESHQRRIQSAEHSGLVVECGQSEKLLINFYRLMALAQQRHQLPLQSFEWFRNLGDCLGESLEIRVVSRAEVSIAAGILLRFRDTVVGKYSCSDARYDNLGAASYLLWSEMLDAKSKGILEFDLGRMAHSNPGLAQPEDEWGGNQAELVYWRYPTPRFAFLDGSAAPRVGKSLFEFLSQPLRKAAGRVLYPHLG